jgi:hypothetical protein
MIRDRLVAGIRHGALLERLQMDENLTLEKAKIASAQSASEGEIDKEAAYLDEVGPGEQTTWCAKIHVNDYSCDFKPDTGAR